MSSRTCSSSRPRRAFTLLELLVVIMLILILVGLLMPALRQARRTAERAVCAAALKQLGVAWVIYAEAYPAALPSAVSFPVPVGAAPPGERTIMAVMSPYLDSPRAFRCAGDDRDYFNQRGTSYEYLPGFLIQLEPANAVLLANWAQQHPQTVPILADAEPFHPAGNDPEFRQSVYYDGHVEALFATLDTLPMELP